MRSTNAYLFWEASKTSLTKPQNGNKTEFGGEKTEIPTILSNWRGYHSTFWCTPKEGAIPNSITRTVKDLKKPDICDNNTVKSAHQWQAKGLHRSKLNGKLFNSRSRIDASIYTNSNHNETVGRHMPLSENKKKKCYKTIFPSIYFDQKKKNVY